MCWRRATFVVFWLAACSGRPGGGLDAGVPDAATIAQPVPPAPPEWTCPTGWRSVSDGELVTCDPFPEGGALDCAADEAHFPGEPGCTRVGSACPTGEWPEGLPGGRPVLYVRAGGTPGGDGTQALPYGTITEALAVAPPTAIVALGKGTFDESVNLGGGLTLWGACVAETRVAASAPDDASGTINVAAAGAELRNLQIGGERPGIWVSGAGASLSAEGVIVANARTVGWLVTGGASATGRDLVVRDTRPRESDGAFGRGLDLEGGAHGDITRAAFEHNHDVGVFASGATTVATLTDVVARDTQGRGSDGLYGRGLSIEGGGHVDVTRAAFDRNHDVGVFALNGAVVTLSDVVVRDTLGQASDGRYGRGLAVELGARVDVTRADFARNREMGVFVAGAAATVTLVDVTVRETQGRQNDAGFGRGLSVQDGARADVTRAVFAHNRELGVFASDPDSVVTLTDVVVRDTESEESTARFGRGLSLELGARADVTRAAFERNREMGVFAAGGGAVLTLTDVAVRDTRGQQSDGRFGRGLDVQDGASADVTRAVFERNREVSLYAGTAGSMLTLVDVVVRDTQSQESDGRFGRGLSVEAGAHAALTRAEFAGNRDVGVFAFGAGSTITLTDLTVADTLAQACEPAGTCGWTITCSMGAYMDAHVEATRFRLVRSALMGVQLANGGTMDLHEGEVAESQIGANVQTAGFDVSRLQDQVVFRDNQVNLDATTLPVPSPSTPTGP